MKNTDCSGKDFAADRRRSLVCVFAAISFWFILRLIYLILFNDFVGDDGCFLNFAESITKGHFSQQLVAGWLRVDIFSACIVQGMLEALSLKIFGFANWYWCAKLPSLIEALILLLFLSKWAMKKHIAPRYLPLLILFVAFDPWFWMRTHVLRMDMALCLFFTVSIYFLYENIIGRKFHCSFLSGIFAGIAVLTKWEALAIPFVAAFAYVLCTKDLKTFIKNSLGFAAGFLIVIAPFAAWVFSDSTRSEILFLQLGYVSSHGQLAHSISDGIPLFLVGLLKLAALKTLALITAMMSMTFYHIGSLGSWVVLTVLLFFSTDLKDREKRFWFVVIALSVFTISQSGWIAGSRQLMFYPLCTVLFFCQLNKHPDKWFKCSFLSACLVIFALLLNMILAKFTEIDLYRSVNSGIKILGLYAVAAGVLTIYRISIAREMKNFKTLIVAILFIISTVLIFRNVRAMISMPGFFYSGNLKQLQSEIYKRFDDKEHRIVVSPKFYPLFPRKCKLFQEDLFASKLYYRYWRSYDDLVRQTDPDALFFTDREIQFWKADPNALKLMREKYVMKDTFTVKQMRFYIYARKVNKF